MRKLTTLLIALVSLLSVSGVSATWRYSNGKVSSVEGQFADVFVEEFEYKVEEVLPGDDQNEDKKNHYDLIYRILWGEDSSVNDGKDVILKTLRKDSIVYCEVNNTSGGNLKKLFLEGSYSENLRFLLVKKSETEFEAYTYDYEPVPNEVFGVTRIEVYKTTIRYGAHVNEETGKTVTEWYADEAHPGTAVLTSASGVRRTINYRTWEHK